MKASFTVFIVAKSNAATNNQVVFIGRPDTAADYSSTDGFGFYMDYQTAIRFYGNYTPSSQYINQSVTTSTPIVGSFVSGSTVINGWTNGAPVSTGATGLATRTTTAQGFAIGASWPGASPFNTINATASIYEIVVYTAALTTDQRQMVEGYLAWKWGINK